MVDLLHDRKARGVSLVLTALIELSDQDSARKALVAARDVLQPDGLAFINTNFPAEAGVAEATRRRLAQHPEVSKLLESIPLPGGQTLASEVAAWLDAGQRLGDLETARRKLESSPLPSGPAQAVKARNRWIRVVNALIEQINLDDPPDEVITALVLAPTRKALARAAQRSKHGPGASGGQGEPTEPKNDPS